MVKRSTRVSGSGSMEGSAGNGATLQTGLASPDFYLPFFHYLSIPKNTAIASYTSYVLKLPIAQTHRIWIEFPKGCAGLVGFQLWRGVEQIFPLPAGVWLRSDAYTLNFAFSHLIDKEPYEVELRGYNLDDTYQHTLWIGLELRGLPSEMSEILASFMREIKG
jgi:hypothetical protein